MNGTAIATDSIAALIAALITAVVGLGVGLITWSVKTTVEAIHDQLAALFAGQTETDTTLTEHTTTLAVHGEQLADHGRRLAALEYREG